jgi:hypothetical protein
MSDKVQGRTQGKIVVTKAFSPSDAAAIDPVSGAYGLNEIDFEAVAPTDFVPFESDSTMTYPPFTGKGES